MCLDLWTSSYGHLNRQALLDKQSVFLTNEFLSESTKGLANHQE